MIFIPSTVITNLFQQVISNFQQVLCPCRVCPVIATEQELGLSKRGQVHLQIYTSVCWFLMSSHYSQNDQEKNKRVSTRIWKWREGTNNNRDGVGVFLSLHAENPSVKLTCWSRDSEHKTWPGSAAPSLCWRPPAASRPRAPGSGPPGRSPHLSEGGWPSRFSATGGCECNTGAVRTEPRLARWWGWEEKGRESYKDNLPGS